MAYPVLMAVGAAMAAASAGMQASASATASRRAENALKDEHSRQNQYGMEQQRTVQQSMAASTPESAKSSMDAERASRAAAYTKAIGSQVPNYQSPVQSSTTVKTGTDMKQRAEIGTRAANVAPTEWELQQMIKNLRYSQMLGTTGFIARDSAGVSPSEVQSALRSTQGMSAGGSVLGSVGSLVGAAGAAGYGPSIGGSGAPAGTYVNPWLDQSILPR